jgi:hypothetical protein
MEADQTDSVMNGKPMVGDPSTSSGQAGFVPIPNERRNAASWEMTETVAPTRRERK